jgi:hypothetical protein
MNFYEKNLESIKRNRDFLYNKMNDTEILSAKNQLEDIDSITTKEDEKALLIKYMNVEYRLNSQYYPTREAKKWADQFEFHNLNNAISIFGFGNGIFVRNILEKMGETDFLVIYEPCKDIFYHVLNHYDIVDILEDKRVSFSVEDINEFEFHNTLRYVINITNLNDQITCVHPFYNEIFLESCVNFYKILKDSFTSIKININTQIFFGQRFIDNLLGNIKYINNSYSIHDLKEELPKEVPAIIVAAGPSIEKQMEALKSAKGRAIIFAVDRILDYLLDNGIEPDFIVTLDPIKPIEYFTKRTDLKIPLICFLQANNEILKHHVGKKIICNCSDFLVPMYLDAKKEPPKVASSTSVATVTFTTCLELGFKNIILVGQDLAYNGNITHAGGIAEISDSSKNVTLEDIHGEQVMSRYDWKEIINWYQDMLTLNSDLNVIDAKDNGAKIKGTTVMTLKEAVDMYCKDKFDNNSIELKKPTFNEDEMCNNKLFFEDNRDELDKINKKSKEAIKICEFLIRENRKNNIESKLAKKELKKLGKINSYIEKQPIYSLMDHFIVASSAQHLLGISHFTDDIKEDNIKTYEKSICIFEAVIEAVDYIIPRLDDAICDIGV